MNEMELSGRISLITVSLVYHRQRRKADKEHAQSFVLCDIEEERSEVGTKEVILSSRRGTFNHWSGSLRPGVYAVIPFSTRFWGRQDRAIRDYTLVIHSSIQLHGVWVNEPATLLTDCLIAATIKYCTKPKRVRLVLFSCYSWTLLMFLGSLLGVIHDIAS